MAALQPTDANTNIKTKFLIISDTHGMSFGPNDTPLQQADVAIHCGDLTNGSKIDEFRHAIKLLDSINAPLKLVIAGNHDFTMDHPAFEKKVTEAGLAFSNPLVVEEYGAPGDARRLFNDHPGTTFLDEGTHQFRLQNGALLTVHASPFTPSLGDWGFQYHPDNGHNFDINDNTNVVITHGPPKGIMDYTHRRQRAGCPSLFAAIARARPQLHCFGHIHEGWGAKLVAWKPEPTENPSHFTDIDNDRSHVIENLAGLKNSRFDSPDDLAAKYTRLERYEAERVCTTSHCANNDLPLEKGSHTLFVNAAFAGADEDGPQFQKPWLIDIELPRAGEDVLRTELTMLGPTSIIRIGQERKARKRNLKETKERLRIKQTLERAGMRGNQNRDRGSQDGGLRIHHQALKYHRQTCAGPPSHPEEKLEVM